MPYLCHSKCTLLGAALLAILGTGCASNRIRAELMRERDELQLANGTLERMLTACQEGARSLEARVARLENFPPDRPVAIFDPVRVEIASLSGGTNLDDQPGDDAVTIYIRLYDADGDAVKAPGRLSVQVFDLSDAGNPSSLGICTLDSAEALRAAWFGRFGTSHFKVVCPIRVTLLRQDASEVLVRVEFVSYLTGVARSTAATLPLARPPA